MKTIVLNTGGGGYWSNTKKAVEIVDMTLGYINDELDFGELRVYFNTKTWNVNELGLIYTDKLFMKELRTFLATHGIVGQDVSYSEQGMQGDDYVSCDVGKEFLDSWAAKFGIDLAQLLADQTAAFEARNALWESKFFG